MDYKHLSACNITHWALWYQELYMQDHDDPNNGIHHYFSYFINQETKGQVR